ncbi:ABC transporter substrate-binding protein [Cryobacterium sp. PH29-G1]|uniref:ABC transporter substrate-binding protein n=1 Tax=Cryobacterium sp. PH29-G1 TaxID=3046211 RepID=UPI0024BADA54|nr:ABC transporter substrate-binding protein [Cryobacterium sp. PH29-G1]MDJ0350242.1 ABC transporter substrate-binding protein [Cryobacterium sp. PH29-G1]
MMHRPLSPRRLGQATAGLGAVMLLSACGTSVGAAPGTADSDAHAVSVTNCGRTINFSATPSAVVGLSPSQTELLLRLGLVDRLVGQAQVGTATLPADLLDQAAAIPVLSDDAPPTREVLLTSGPDFVYSPTGYEFTAEQGFASIEQLERADVAAYTATGGCFDRRNSGTVSDIFTDITNLGIIFDVPEEAAALAAQGRTDLGAVENALSGQDRLRVAQLFVDGNSLSAIGAGVEADMIRLAGGDNVYSSEDPAFKDFFAASITPESLAKENPDAVVFAVRTDDEAENTRDYLRATFPAMTAVVEDRLIAVSASDVFPGTLGNIRVVQQVAAELYPSAF